MIDILKLLKLRLNFTTTNVYFERYGVKKDSGKWNGIIGNLVDGNIDLIQAFFSNTTWYLRCGKILPDLEFFPWVLSFLLEFKVFPWDFWIFLQFYCHILINFDIFPLEFNFSKIFVNKNAIKSPTPSKILSFDRKIKFFSWIFLIGGKILPEVEFFPWIFGLSLSFFDGRC